ncbi:alpha/beta fold hydrolase [Oscillatoria sp. FACHB-1407]|uniref:YqiA/YcfP family alpha/beta fold hydrolase n=1 Tax=Oscillatoria sp. FACHB-1407 TaxID=2692847 RepID=UPI0016865D35|nr:YqiA/YcfP family alpha/beta fold hydrolase [Oscillatoria sp. FACHB-1407]MBD2459933.1 alpha/beta fold hydrolase [Oscillatoria sp. FACHB-1407]
MTSYIYLHGFASSPRSAKARDLGDRFRSLSIPLVIPDLNQGDFSHLTITRQLQQVQGDFPPSPTPVTLIGSSLGGLTAAWLAEKDVQVQRLVLLAPAFSFLSYWLPKLSIEQLDHWQTEQFLSVYHYAEGRSLPLHYEFVQDAMQYHDDELQRSIPTLILHGKQDEVIPVQASRDYAQSRPWVKLIELDSDHALGTVKDEIWQAICEFCELDNPKE